MGLNPRKIGDLIRIERERKGFSQQHLANLITDKLNSKKDLKKDMSRQKIAKIERGDLDIALNFQIINALCDIFECDAAYLLCEIPEHTHKKKLICETTGLSETAVSKLISFYDSGYIMKNISDIICNDRFQTILSNIQYHKIYVTAYKEKIEKKLHKRAYEYTNSLRWEISHDFDEIIREVSGYYEIKK